MKTVDVVSFMLVKNGKILVEKRKKDNETDPGKVAIPGGHVEPGESREQACSREMREELGVEGHGFRFVAKLLHRTEIENHMIYYYLCESWDGMPKSIEADKVFWTGAGEPDALDLEADRKAMKRLMKMMDEGKANPAK